MLHLNDVSVRHGARTVLRGIGFSAAPGTVTALAGANGSGKSSLLRAVLGLCGSSGEIRIGGEDRAKLSRRDLAARIGFLPQDIGGTARLSVLDVVLLGRIGRLGWQVPREDIDVALAALDDLDMAALAGRPIGQLSGGQRQMVYVAQALARQPGLLLLDEPTSALDLRHQLQLMELLCRIARTRNVAVVMAVHDLNLVLRFAGRVAVLHGGRLHAHGTPDAVLTPALLAEVFGIEAAMAHTPSGAPSLVPLRALAEA